MYADPWIFFHRFSHFPLIFDIIRFWTVYLITSFAFYHLSRSPPLFLRHACIHGLSQFWHTSMRTFNTSVIYLQVLYVKRILLFQRPSFHFLQSYLSSVTCKNPYLCMIGRSIINNLISYNPIPSERVPRLSDPRPFFPRVQSFRW